MAETSSEPRPVAVMILQDHPATLWTILHQVHRDNIIVWGPWTGTGDRRWRLTPTNTRAAEIWRETGSWEHPDDTSFSWAINPAGSTNRPPRSSGTAPTLEAAMAAADENARHAGVLLVETTRG